RWRATLHSDLPLFLPAMLRHRHIHRLTHAFVSSSKDVVDSMGPSRALAYARAHRLRFLEDLKCFIRFPTISAQSKHRGDLTNCASWLAEHLRRVGLDHVQVLPAQQHPIVYGESLQAPERPTVLIYGHYDVQPVDPLREWRAPPFVPTIRG